MPSCVSLAIAEAIKRTGANVADLMAALNHRLPNCDDCGMLREGLSTFDETFPDLKLIGEVSARPRSRII